MWTSPHQNITLAPVLQNLLSSIPKESSTLHSPNSSSTLFSQSEVSEIMAKATEQEWKAKLTANTTKALEQGAFGAPWMWVTRDDDGEEKGEPFFGSDRWHFLWEFLGVVWRDVEILPKAKGREIKL